MDHYDHHCPPPSDVAPLSPAGPHHHNPSILHLSPSSLPPPLPLLRCPLPPAGPQEDEEDNADDEQWGAAEITLFTQWLAAEQKAAEEQEL